jgi:hypothetical protein
VTSSSLQLLSRRVSSTEFQNDSRLPGSSVSRFQSSVVGISNGVTPFEDSSVGIGDTATGYSALISYKANSFSSSYTSRPLTWSFSSSIFLSFFSILAFSRSISYFCFSFSSLIAFLSGFFATSSLHCLSSADRADSGCEIAG